MRKKYSHPVVEAPAVCWHRSDMDNMRKLREARGLTQTQLAAAIGANQGTISKIERGDGNPTLDVIIRIAAALRVHPSDMFSRGTLEERAIAALHGLDDEHAVEAAVTVLEAMASQTRR
jgi:transcriptional regulator with XRE-family HTH domain